MSCIIPADLTNGKESNLYNKLLEIYNGDESRAKASYSYFRTPQFLERFGNYSEALDNENIPKHMSSRLDEETFEPLLRFDSALQKHYFLDKYNEKVFYPFDRQGLNGIFETNEVKEFAKSLAFTFYNKYLSFDVDTLEFVNASNLTLREFIEEFVEETGYNLLDSDESSPEQMSLGGALLDSLDFISEWENEVITIYNSFKLDVVSEEEDETQHIRDREEDTQDNLIRVESFLKDSKDNVNNNIKLYLSLIEREQTNMFGLKKFVEFGDIYTSLNRTLADVVSIIDENGNPEDLFEIYKQKIGELGETKPYFKGLYDALDQELGSTDIFKNQIVSAFRLTYNNYLGSEFYRDKNNNIDYTTRNLSEVSSRRRNLLKQWNFNFSQNNYTDKKEFKSPLPQISKNYRDFRTVKRSITSIEQLFSPLDIGEKSIMDKLIEDLDTVGITLNTEGKLSDRDKSYDIQKGLLFFLDDLSLSGSTLEDKKDQILNLYDSLNRGLQRITDNKSNNLFSDQKIFTKLAEAEAFFQEEGSDASIFSVGKTKWVYSLPSYLSEKITSWKKAPKLLFNHYMSSPYSKGSEYMKYLLGIDKVENVENLSYDEWKDNHLEDSKVRLSEIELGIFNSTQVKGDATNAEDSKSIGSFDATIDYFNKLLAFRKQAKVYHKSALAADKSTEYQIHYGNALSKKSGVTRYDLHTNEYNFNSDVLEVFYNYFKSEYNRMAEEYEKIQNLPDSEKIDNYHTKNENALKSQLFPSMSITKDADGNIVLPEDPELTDLYDPETGKAHLETLDGHKETIINKIRKILSQNVDSLHSQMMYDGIFVIDEKGNYQNIGLDSVVFDNLMSEEQYEGMATKTAVADVLINSIISQVEYSKMFTGDVAYYKNMVDYKKRVPASYTDGLYLNITERKDVYFNAAVIDSVEIPAPYLDNLAELLGEEGKETLEYYRNVNAADAQAWITPQRWKFLKEKLGKWSSKDDVLYSKMQNENAVFEADELKKLAQPLKGVYFDIVNGAPRYLKYSQAVLLPKTIKGTDLQKLYDKMVLDENGNELDYEDQIHEVITKDGMKVGAQGVSKIHNQEGNIIDNMELNSFQLTNSGWKLQQDLSPKGFKSTELGSQIMKIIFQGLSRNLGKDFYVGNTVMKGSDLINHIHDIVSNLSDRGIEKVMRKLGVNPESFEIENEDKLYSAMIDDLSKRRDTADNTLKALLAGTSPYGIPGQFQIFQNVFSSAINKAAVKVRTNGGSFIQMADFGISKSEAEREKNGIRFAPWFNESNAKLHTPEKYVDEEGRERVKPGGVFISGSFIAKYIPDYRQMTDEELFGSYNSNKNRYEGGAIDERILRNIVGYRIPNQGLPSNDAFHVMGLLPEDAADTIVAYTGITTKTGSDFDIDKMYIMMPSYYAETNTKDEAYRYIIDKFTGDTIRDTIDNLSRYLTDLTGSELDKEQLAEAIKDNAGRKQLTRDLKDALVKVILDSKNANSEVVKEIKSKFDIKVKKLKYATPLLKKNEDNELEERPLYDQPVEAIHNKLIESYVSVLTSTHAIQDIMKPIDEPFVEDDIKNMYPEVSRNDMMDFDAVTDIKLKQEFKLGKAGLGQNVNALTDSTLGSMANLGLLYINIEGGHNGAKGVEFDKEYSVKLGKEGLKSYVESYNEFNSESPIRIEDIEYLNEVKLNDAMKALVNGFVDIAKDPFITRGGWNTQTNDVGFLLVRAGVHPFYINAFLGQPIMKEYTDFVDNNESNTIDNTDNLKEQFILKKARDKFSKESRTDSIKINEVELTTEGVFNRGVDIKTLLDFQRDYTKAKNDIAREAAESKFKSSINTNLTLRTFKIPIYEENEQVTELVKEVYNAAMYYLDPVMISDYSEPTLTKDLGYLRGQIKEKDEKFQMQVLSEFFDFIPLAKNLNRSTKGSKATTDGKGKNIGSLIVANNYVRDILKQELEEKPGALSGFATKLKRNGRDTFLNRIIKNSILTPYKIMRANPKYFLSANDETVSSFNYVSYRLFENRLQDQRLADDLEKSHQSYILSGFAPLQMDNISKEKLFNELPVKISELKEDPVFKNNALIDTLYVKDGTYRSYIAMPNNKKSPSFKNSLTDAWRHLLEQHPDIGEDLIKYSFHISGFNMSINQFHDFIPYEWFNKHGLNSYIRSLGEFNETGGIDMEFINQFHRHNFENSRYTKRIFEAARKKIEGVKFTEAFVIDSTNNPSQFAYVVETPNDLDVNAYEQVEEKLYYKLIGSVGSLAYYVRTTPLGALDKEGNKIVEYNMNARSLGEETESMIHTLPTNISRDNIQMVIDKYSDLPIDSSIMVNETDTEDVVDLLELNDSEPGELLNMIITGKKDNQKEDNDPFQKEC